MGPFYSIYMISFLGVRGNASQEHQLEYTDLIKKKIRVHQLVGRKGLMSGPQGG